METFLLWEYLQDPGSESMHSRDRNVDSEEVRMSHRTIGLIKINTLNLRTPICTLTYKNIPCIITFTFLNTWINE